jgi:hypothetical protein
VPTNPVAPTTATFILVGLKLFFLFQGVLVIKKQPPGTRKAAAIYDEHIQQALPSAKQRFLALFAMFNGHFHLRGKIK